MKGGGGGRGKGKRRGEGREGGGEVECFERELPTPPKQKLEL